MWFTKTVKAELWDSAILRRVNSQHTFVLQWKGKGVQEFQFGGHT